MPVEGLQRRVAALLKPNRPRQSFVGGSSVFNTTFPRRSEDMDVYAHVPTAERITSLVQRRLSERGAFGAIGTAPVETWTGGRDGPRD